MPRSRPFKISEDRRVQEMAECMAFAINNFKNKPVMNQETNLMESWHAWFRRVLTEAGFVVKDAE